MIINEKFKNGYGKPKSMNGLIGDSGIYYAPEEDLYFVHPQFATQHNLVEENVNVSHWSQRVLEKKNKY